MRPQWPVRQQICHLERRVAVPVPAADKDGSVDLRQKASASEGGNGSRRRPLRHRSSLAPPAQDDVDVADDADDDEVQHIPAPANQGGSDRANWSDENTKIFCQLWIEQIHTEECINGNMSKKGMRKLIAKYKAATNLLHVRSQFMHKFRGLKEAWLLIQKLRKDSGLGAGRNGSVAADNAWWEAETEGRPDLKRLRYRWPKYVAEMDTMFFGNTVDGSTSSVAGGIQSQAKEADEQQQEDPEQHAVASGHDGRQEEEPDGIAPFAGTSPSFAGTSPPLRGSSSPSFRGTSPPFRGSTTPRSNTPASSDSRKRGSSTSTTASSPNKRRQSPVVDSMDKFMYDSSQFMTSKLNMFENQMQQKQKHAEAQLQLRQKLEELKMTSFTDKINQVQQLARECGVEETDWPLWQIVFKICQVESTMDFFIGMRTAAGRLEFIKNFPGILGSGAMGQPKWYSWRNEQTEEWWDPYDSNDDDVLREFLEDDLGHIVAGMVRFTEHHEKYLNRAEYRIPKVSAEEWVQNMLSSRDSCYDLFRMSPTMFYRLHEVLVESYGLQSTSKSSSIEALGMFLWMVGGQQSFRTVQHILTRSTGTIHKNFVKVLECLVKLSDNILTPRDPEFRTIHPKLQEARFHGLFNNCIGAIDGTHIPCIVPSDKVIEYMNRKGKTSQNVMAICDFDMRFIFVNAGWPGSVHDMRVFNDSRTRWSDRFPHPPQGKYYLVDSGYPNRPGYLAPYRQTKYH
ncbi:unnamed protein product, partial [Urochloa humidicola]